MTLHSNLVQFKLSPGQCTIENITHFTFQSGTIQARGRNPCLTKSFILYIPIWYNSSHLSKPFIKCFRPSLHSNLVQFKPERSGALTQMPIYFTFQSGTIQAIVPRHPAFLLLPLHSNLVQFKPGHSHSA